MSDALVLTCRSGCALCEELAFRLSGKAEMVSVDVILETPQSIASRFVIAAWPRQKSVHGALPQVVKSQRPPRTIGADRGLAHASDGSPDAGKSPPHQRARVQIMFS